jgi:NADH dehydrogenase
MILVTGGTGFVGKALIRQLAENDYPVRTLIRPSPDSPNLPAGIPVEVAVSSLTDERGLRGAMVGVDTVYHLASAEWRGARADLMQTDIQGSRAVTQAAVEAGVKRLFFVSHLGADRASAYPVLKAKAISEEHIRRSGIDYTILRTAILYGPGDAFTNGLARLLRTSPYFFFIPSEGKVLLQPLWVEDLVTCLTWSLEEPDTINKMFEIGGPEYLTFNQIVERIMDKTGIRRSLVSLHPPYMRAMTVAFESLFPGLPVSVYWLDYLAANRTCALDTVPRIFGLLPSRLSHRLDYLEGQQWRQPLIRSLMRRRR